MTAAEKLREIVAAAKGNTLERLLANEEGERPARHLAGRRGGGWIDRERRRRAEWQEASDLLERLLSGRRPSKEDRA